MFFSAFTHNPYFTYSSRWLHGPFTIPEREKIRRLCFLCRSGPPGDRFCLIKIRFCERGVCLTRNTTESFAPILTPKQVRPHGNEPLVARTGQYSYFRHAPTLVCGCVKVLCAGIYSAIIAVDGASLPVNRPY